MIPSGIHAHLRQTAAKRTTTRGGLNARSFGGRDLARSTVRGIQNAHDIPRDVLLHAAMDPVDKHLAKAVNRLFLRTRRRKSENVVVMVHGDDQRKRAATSVDWRHTVGGPGSCRSFVEHTQSILYFHYRSRAQPRLADLYATNVDLLTTSMVVNWPQQILYRVFHGGAEVPVGRFVQASRRSSK